MWRKPEEPKPSAPRPDVGAAPKFEPSRADSGASGAPAAGGSVTKSIAIRGEITGRENLYIDGEVEGHIRLSDGVVTVGPNGRVNAEIEAREVIVHGKVKGPLRGRDRVQIGRTGEVLGDVVTQRIAIEDGALLRGMVEIASVQELASRATPVGAHTAGGRPVPVPVKET